MLDLELMCAGIAMRSRPDISLFDCLRLIIDGYSTMDIARHFAPHNFTKKQFDAFYNALDYWLKGAKVQRLLGSYFGKIVIIIYLILTVDCIDF